MTNRSAPSFGYRPTTQHLRYAAGALALIVAGLHLFHPRYGMERFVRLLASDPALLITHPRPLAFVLSAIAIVLGIYLAVYGFLEKPIYLLGVLLMGTYIVGYFAWHLSGHGGFLPGRPPHYHGLEPHEAVISHLRSDSWAVAALLAETLLAAILILLYRRE